MDTDTMALLQALKASSQDDASEEIFVSSIHDANILLQQNMHPGGAAYRKKLVDYITDPRNRVLSKCDIYHNFIMDLFRVGDYDLGLKVCEFALTFAPYHRDMLGDAIQACGHTSQWEKGDEYLKRAMEIPKGRWSFRLFLYSINYLKNKMAAYSTDDILYEQALTLADEFIKYLPFDEHGYDQKAEILLAMNHRSEAIEVLQEAIFNTHPDEQDSTSILVTAQCCVTLLGILDDSSDYDLIINVCNQGLRNTTQSQPSANIGYFIYRKALALDAKAHKEEFQIPATINQALKFYQSAYDLNEDRDYGRTIEQRYAALRPYAQEFEPLVKRSLVVDRTEREA